MSITAQVVEHPPGTVEGRPDVDDPLLLPQPVDEPGEAVLCARRCQAAGEGELPIRESLPEIVDELPAEDLRHGLDGEEEVLPCADPALAVVAERASRDHAVKVDVMEQSLVPGVKDARETEPPAEGVLRIAGELLERSGHCLEEKVEYGSLVAEREPVQLVRQREDGVVVRHGQEVSPARLEPARLGEGLALRAAPPPAGGGSPV